MQTLLPSIGISPGEGPHADPMAVPPLAWAKVHIPRHNQIPSQEIPPNVLSPNDDPSSDTDEDEDNDEYTDEEIATLEAHIDESAYKIGFSPISKKDIDSEENIIVRQNNLYSGS